MGNQQATLPTEEDLAWLGGILDGEGCISLSRRPGGNFKPCVTVGNTSFPLLRECVRILDGLGVGHWEHVSPAGKSKRTRPMGCIEIQGYKRLEKFLSVMAPYIRAKRDQADLLLEYARHRIETHARHRRIKTHGDYDEQVYQQLRDMHRGAPETIREGRATDKI